MPCFDLSFQGHVAHLKLCRPEQLNTMSAVFWQELDALLEQLHHSNKARVLVISSSGKHFSAGMSLEVFSSELALGSDSPEQRAAIPDQLSQLQSTFTKLEKLRIPTLAVIQGGCIGGAVDLVSACCLRYASAEAFFCIQEINVGLVADLGTLQRLPKLMPLAVVKHLAYTGRRMKASEALSYGFINQLSDTPEQALEAALADAEEIASKPPVAIWGTKQALHYARDHSVDEALVQMGWLQAGIWSNEHVSEAISALKQQRPAQFPALAELK